jgi:hypothetical protein
MQVKRAAHYLDYVVEANLIALFLTFPFALKFFNDAWMALLILYAASKLLRREDIALPPTTTILIFFVASIVVSTTTTHLEFGKTRYLFMGLGTCLFAYDWFSRDEKRLSRVVFYFICSALFASCAAIYEMLFGDLPVHGRAEGPFSNTFYLSLWTGTGLFLAIIILAKSRGRAMLLCCLGAVIVLASAFILSKTRASWVAMMLILGLTGYFLPNKRTVLIVAGTLATLLGGMVVLDESLRMRLLAVIQNADDLRWPMWQKTAEYMTEQFGLRDWLLGRGPRAYSINLLYAGQTITFAFPHFMPVELLYSFGICGTSAFLVWFGALCYRTIMLLRERASWLTLRPVGMTAVLVLLTCFFNESFFARYFAFPFWFFSGISLALVNEGERAQNESFDMGGHSNPAGESVIH